MLCTSLWMLTLSRSLTSQLCHCGVVSDIQRLSYLSVHKGTDSIVRQFGQNQPHQGVSAVAARWKLSAGCLWWRNDRMFFCWSTQQTSLSKRLPLVKRMNKFGYFVRDIVTSSKLCGRQDEPIDSSRPLASGRNSTRFLEIRSYIG